MASRTRPQTSLAGDRGGHVRNPLWGGGDPSVECQIVAIQCPSRVYGGLDDTTPYVSRRNPKEWVPKYEGI
jgi:hypothetical protein